MAEEVVAANSKLDGAEQLTSDEMEIDPELRSIIENETQQKVAQLQREMAWESEKKRLAVSKLKAAFVDDIQGKTKAIDIQGKSKTNRYTG